MRFYIFFLLLILGCNASSVHKTINASSKTFTSTLNLNSDSVWNKLMLYSFQKHYKIKEMDKAAGTITMNINDVPISYRNKDGKLNDTTAIGLVDVMHRVSNLEYVYPQRGYVDCSILILKNSATNLDIHIALDDRCSITTFFENGFVNKRLIPNVPIQSLGKIENEIISFIH